MRAIFTKLLVFSFLFVLSFCDYSDYMTKLIDQKEIDEKIRVVSKKLCQEYKGKRLVVMSVLKGGVFISADIMNKLDIPCEIEFVKCSSYRGARHSGMLDIRFLNEINIRDKHLLIVDDIFDSGKTLLGLIKRVQLMKPETIKSLVLLKKNVKRDSDYNPDYTLFEIENNFVIGYGLDFREYYRGLKGIWVLHPPYPLPFD